jgi:hypothetical protein
MVRASYPIRIIALAILTLCSAQTAAAQVTSLGTTTSGPATDLTNGSLTVSFAFHAAVAYDDKHDVFLHVWEDQGTIVGRFIGFDGTPRGIAFTIAPAVAVDPKVVYSKDAADDVFCVLVTQRQPDGSFPGSAIVSFVRFTGTGPTGGTPIGAPTTLATSLGVADAVFNPNARRFLLAWDVATGVALQHVDGAGTPMDAVVTIAAGQLRQSLHQRAGDPPGLRLAATEIHADGRRGAAHQAHAGLYVYGRRGPRAR